MNSNTHLDDVIASSLDDNTSIAGLLRRCLVLSYHLNNDALKKWVESELNGYGAEDQLPRYREVNAPAKGLMLGTGGSTINDQPLPSALMNEEHRHFAESVRLTEPIAAYQELRNQSGNGGSGRARVEWPANLTGKYQKTFFGASFVLNRAWQEIPSAAFVSVVDTVRTRILTFALELQKEVGKIPGNVIASIPSKIVQTHVVNIILGNNNVLSSSAGDINIHANQIVAGDFQSLQHFLSSLGVGPSEIVELEAILGESENIPETDGGLRPKLKQWAGKAGAAVVSTGKAVGTTLITEALRKYIGLS